MTNCFPISENNANRKILRDSWENMLRIFVKERPIFLIWKCCKQKQSIAEENFVVTFFMLSFFHEIVKLCIGKIQSFIPFQGFLFKLHKFYKTIVNIINFAFKNILIA